MRPTIHELIIAEIKARASAIEVSRPRLDQISKNANGVKPSKYSSGAGISVTETPFENRIFLNGNRGMRLSTGALPPFMGPLQSGQAAARDLLESVLRQVSGVLGKISENEKLMFRMFPMFLFQLLNVPLSNRKSHNCWRNDGGQFFYTK